jgi:hypothetical protein
MWRNLMSSVRLAAAVILLTTGASFVGLPTVRADLGTDCFEREDFACLTGTPHEGYLCDEPGAEDCYNCKKDPGVCNGGPLGSLEGYRSYNP